MTDKKDQSEKQGQEVPYDLHVRFIGSDLLYWQRFQEKFGQVYESLKIKFTLKNPTLDKFNPMHEYLSLIEDQVEILLFEAIYEHPRNIDFIKYVRRDEATKRISTTVLYTFNCSVEEVSQMTTAGARINQIKSDEFSGVIFAAMALHNAEKTKIPPLLFVPYEKDITIIQQLRLSYLTKDYYSIETNSPIVPGTEVDLGHHPFKEILPHCKFEVRTLSEQNLYYYKRFNLKLFPVLEDPSIFEKDILKWISNSRGKIVPKKTKILLIDPTLNWFKVIDKSIKEIEFTVNFQTSVDRIDSVLSRRRHQIICLAINKNDPNSIISVRRLAVKIKNMVGYAPYVLVVNCPVSTEVLKKSLQYEHIMAIADFLSPEQLKGMAQSLEHKLKLIENESEVKKVYFNSSQEHVKIDLPLKVRLLGMTENMIYFQSDQVIPDFTVFNIDTPINALVTTVPHFKVTLKELPKTYYIGLINFTGEQGNSKIRNYLNKLIKESKEPKTAPAAKESHTGDSNESKELQAPNDSKDPKGTNKL